MKIKEHQKSLDIKKSGIKKTLHPGIEKGFSLYSFNAPTYHASIYHSFELMEQSLL